MFTYGHIYRVWDVKARPSCTTSRMTRTTLKYLASANGVESWEQMPALPLEHALTLLDGAMSRQNLGPQSRSNYRGYLRRVYRFIGDEGLEIAEDANGRLWPTIPDEVSAPRRAQLAYARFVRWAIGRDVWPKTVRPDDFLHWARDEKTRQNQHWRKEYVRLQHVCASMVAQSLLPPIEIPPIPPRATERYAVPVQDWPTHLRQQWDAMCRDASQVLRKGGMRQWRAVTKDHYEIRLAQFLGWLTSGNGPAVQESDTWTTLLSADNFRKYLNWLIGRNGKDHLNPGHTAFLRMIRGLHRFLLGSGQETIQSINDLVKRCEVTERDKAVRIVPFASLQSALSVLLETECSLRLGRKTAEHSRRLAEHQVDTLIFGMLVHRALRSRNIRKMRFGSNLVPTEGGYFLRFGATEMKGHRAFETSFPAALLPVIQDYLARGLGVLTGQAPQDEADLLVSRSGRPFSRASFAARVVRLSKKYLGKPVSAHLFRHIVATHAAQVLKMTPPELAALLAHRSATTCMKYYEVTNPTLAAARFEKLNGDHSM